MAPGTALKALIREEIRTNGPISFARFMELALYCPNLGYYERPDSRIGKTGDYYTSVSVGPLFGRLLAFRLAKWLESLPGGVEIVEAGAHNGQLALDILKTLPSSLLQRLEYWIIEPSENRQNWQRKTLNEFAGNVRWFAELPGEVRGVIFSNELLDSMPFQRLGWDAKRQGSFEWRVTEDFQWTRVPAPGDVPPELAPVLPDGYTWENNAAATKWWEAAARCLAAGKLMAIDYFVSDEDLWRPERVQGTARAYTGHRVSGDLLASPGEQDITAHVPVAALREIGRRAGLAGGDLMTQAVFLTRVIQEGAELNSAEMSQFKTLTHPEHLGHRFKVLVQSRA